MNAERLERELADFPVPPPPAGLADRIKAEIPAELAVGTVVNFRPAAPRRQWRLAAAAVVTLALTGAVTWEMRHRRMSEDLLAPTQAEVQPTPVVTASEADTPVVLLAEPVAQGGAVDAKERRAEYRREIRGSLAAQTAGRQVDGQNGAAQAGPPSVPSSPPAARSNEAEQFMASPPERTTSKSEAAIAGAEEHLRRQLAPPAGRDQDTLATLKSLGYLTGSPPSPAAKGEAKKDGWAFLAEAQAPSTHPPAPRGPPAPNDQPYGDVFFEDAGVNPFVDTEDDRFSTFGLEVDTASYTVARRYLRDGHLPPREAIRVEEVVNALSYGDRGPAAGDFALSAEGAPTPFGEGERYHVLRFAVTARAVDRDQRPPAVLTFVVDVSGSMAADNRLGLVKQALYELLAQLRADDRVGLVVYGSRGEVLLEPTTDHQRIRSSIDRLRSGGSTNAEEGLVLAYDLAARFLDAERINRVILCSDGVANVGRTGPESILARIESDAERGVELTTVGFGMGNYNDVLMEQLADAGDGRYAYVDTLSEARRLFVEELTGTLLTLGREAKAQVEFDPRVVRSYRLLGYENRDIADERFRDPTVDAGEIGAGHTVTALYEVKLQPEVSRRDTVATLRFRYVPIGPTGATEAVELERALRVKDLAPSWDAASPALRLASLAGEYAELLKGTYWARGGSFAEVLRRTQQLTPSFAGDARVADFASLVATAAQLSPKPSAPPRQVTDGE